MTRISIIAFLSLFLLLSCEENNRIKTLELNFKNIIQIVNYDNYTITKSIDYPEYGDEDYYLELYDQHNLIADRFRGFPNEQGSFTIDSINKQGIYLTWFHWKNAEQYENEYIEQFNEFKTAHSKLGRFAIFYNTICYSNTGIGSDIIIDSFNIIDKNKVEFIFKGKIVTKIKISELDLLPNLSYQETKSNNFDLHGGKECNISIDYHLIKSTKSGLIDNIKNEIKKLAITNAIANAGLRVR
jgi:hypothetical protein